MDKSTKNNGHQRNSGVELLRILAMLMIVLNHSPFSFLQGNILPHSGDLTLVTQAVLSSFGGIGDVLFFGITAWYLCDRAPSFRQSCKRAWKLEQELLFYSIGLFVLVAFVQFTFQDLLGLGTIGLLTLGVKSLFPTIMGFWWYPSAYILFTLLHYWIGDWVKSLSGKQHAMLCLVSLTIWSWTPLSKLYMSYGLLLFIFQYILISFVHWHTNIFSAHIGRIFAVTGFTLTIVGILLVFSLIGMSPHLGYFNSPRGLPALLTGVGLIVIASKSTWKSPIINYFASTMLAPYLILTYPAWNNYLQTSVKIFETGKTDWLIITTYFFTALIFISACFFIDVTRQKIFKVFLRRRGHWIDTLCNNLNSCRFLNTSTGSSRFGVCGLSESAGVEQASGDVVGEVAKTQGDAS
ncbi:acyltransferase [Bifidobacterium mongoliense]|uniref:acyltransferase family protein n=1 Tax=Bifidobacterium mongoliense TaxID=518643 RepID=UPI0030ED83B8